MTKGQIEIAIVDDDPFVRTSLATILGAQPDIEVCGEAGDGSEAVALYRKEEPDILLMDIQMPGCDGLAAAKEILGTHGQARIVFLTTFSDDEYIVSALRLGAKGYLIKSEVSNIAPALRSVMAGQMVLGGEVLDKVDALMGAHAGDGQPRQAGAPDGCSQREAALLQGLTAREFEIIELVSQGLDNKEIAGAVFIGEGTVRNHVSTILQKLGLKNRTQLAVYYYRNLDEASGR